MNSFRHPKQLQEFDEDEAENSAKSPPMKKVRQPLPLFISSSADKNAKTNQSPFTNGRFASIYDNDISLQTINPQSLPAFSVRGSPTANVPPVTTAMNAMRLSDGKNMMSTTAETPIPSKLVKSSLGDSPKKIVPRQTKIRRKKGVEEDEDGGAAPLVMLHKRSPEKERDHLNNSNNKTLELDMSAHYDSRRSMYSRNNSNKLTNDSNHGINHRHEIQATLNKTTNTSSPPSLAPCPRTLFAMRTMSANSNLSMASFSSAPKYPNRTSNNNATVTTSFRRQLSHHKAKTPPKPSSQPRPCEFKRAPSTRSFASYSNASVRNSSRRSLLAREASRASLLSMGQSVATDTSSIVNELDYLVTIDGNGGAGLNGSSHHSRSRSRNQYGSGRNTHLTPSCGGTANENKSNYQPVSSNMYLASSCRRPNNPMAMRFLEQQMSNTTLSSARSSRSGRSARSDGTTA